VILGYVLAVLAAVASGSGSILESAGVRRAGAFGGSPQDLVALRRQPLYFLGVGVDLLGFVFAAAALHRLPLFLVQSVLAFSVGVTATISAVLGVRLAGAGWAALGVGATGLVLLGLSADPGPAQPLSSGWKLLLVGVAVVIAAIAFTAQRGGGRWSPIVLGFCGGLGFSAVGISARTLDASGPAWRLVLEPAIWAMIANGLVAAVAFAMALQRGRATAVTAIMFTTNTAVSSLIGVTLLDDRVRVGFTAAAVAGFVLAVAGAIGTAHYAHRTSPAGVPEPA
jgi:drug/metabolite transporter (DMT)-like permease